MSDERFRNVNDKETSVEVEEQTAPLPQAEAEAIPVESETLVEEEKTETVSSAEDDQEIIQEVDEVLEESAAPAETGEDSADFVETETFGSASSASGATAFSVEYEEASSPGGSYSSPTPPRPQNYQAQYPPYSAQQFSQPQPAFAAPQSSGIRFGRTDMDGPIRPGLMVWGVVLLIFGLMTLFGAVGAPINFQFLFTALLALAGVAFIVLAILQSNKGSARTSQTPQTAQAPRTPQQSPAPENQGTGQGQPWQNTYGGSFQRGNRQP